MFDASPLDAEVRAAYLRRLGVDPEPPGAEALTGLVERHAERVPYETIWIHAGEAWDIDPYAAAARIALHDHGGYCYHNNGALGLLLASLGYAVRGHVGGVHGSDGPNPAARGNHLVLTVDVDGQTWYVDAGLSDALHSPVPLAAGPLSQPPFEMAIEQVDGGWHLTHDPTGGFTGMTWWLPDARRSDFEDQHRRLSTEPDSGFVQVAMAERRDATGVDVVRGLVLGRIGEGARTHEPITRRQEWFDLLADLFGIRFDASPAGATDRLWSRVLEAHQRWEDEQSSQR